MTDPFESLRAPVVPADPDPDFARRLRARMEAALRLPRGVIPMTAPTSADTTTADTTAAAPASAPPAGAPGGVIPYLAVRGARTAIDWYAQVLGARPVGEPVVMPDGRIGHAELRMGGGDVYLADEHPEIGVAAPAPEAAAVSLVLTVADVDRALAQARDAGAAVTREPYDAHGHRNGTIVDPFGHRWLLQAPLGAAPAPLPAAPRHGDAGYTSLWVPDVARAGEFYAAVLGWTYETGSDGRSLHVTTAIPRQGLVAGSAPAGPVFAAYAVDDVAAAVRRVRAAGGTAAEPAAQPWGRSADCSDDQGWQFALYQPAPGTGTGAEPPSNGSREGDLAYLTLLVPDSARFRAFFGAVLGWQFAPGHVEDGWEVTTTRPMTGIAGGQEEVTGVPMWRVDDIAAAVARVRAAGGRSSDPERQPYGVSADCYDDQGTHFFLGQLS